MKWVFCSTEVETYLFFILHLGFTLKELLVMFQQLHEILLVSWSDITQYWMPYTHYVLRS